MTLAAAHPPLRASGRASLKAVRPSRGWRRYLVLAALLVPLVVPEGPGQSSMLDLVNLPAMAMFMLFMLSGHRLRAPFFAPVLIISVGSVLASFGAPSVTRAGLAVTQDAYLFGWFLMLVNVMTSENDVRAVRLTWVVAGVLVALTALAQVLHASGSLSGLIAARGIRPEGTFTNTNMLADYLVMTLFVTASLWREIPRRILLPVMGTLLVGLIATKSNGGLISLAVGFVVWFVVRALTSRMSWRPVFALLALTACLGGLGVWLNSEWHIGDAQLQSIRRHTFANRMEKSAEDRGRIREKLARTYARSPLGIGPGNSSALTVGISERERRDSYRSKEAHSDYVAYAIERGPLGIFGLFLMTAMGFWFVWCYWRDCPQRGVRSRRVARWTACMAGALAASATHSMVVEKLHFRHYWLFMAMVCASMYAAQKRAERRRTLVREEPVRVPSVGLPPRVPGRVAALAPAAAASRALPPRQEPAKDLGRRTSPALARSYAASGGSNAEVLS